MPFLLRLAELQEEQDKLLDALETRKKIIEVSPYQKRAQESYIRVCLKAAKHLEEKEKYKEALKLYQNILDIKPDHEIAEEGYMSLRFKAL